MSRGIIFTVFAVICFYLFLLSIFTTCFMVYTDEHVFYLKDYAPLMCLGLICLCILLTLIRKKRILEISHLKQAAVIGSVVLAAFLAFFVLFMKLKPIYDQGMIYYSAGRLLSGDFTDWKKGAYYSMLSYQNGMMLMMCPFVALFRENGYLAFQLFNIPVMLLTYLGVAKISGIYFGKKSAYVTYLALLSVVPAWTYVTFVYGTWPSFCLAVWAIWLEIRFEQTEKWRYAVLCGVCMMFSIMWKSNSEIFLVAICIMLLLHAVRNKSWKMPLGMLIILFFSYLEIKGVPWIVHEITGENTSQGIPFIAWLAMGMQESSIAPGWYNEFPMNLYKKLGPNAKAITAASLQSFAKSFALFDSQKEYMFRFFARKLASMWADPAFQCFTSVNTRNLKGTFPYLVKDIFYNGGIVNTILYLFFDVLQSIQYFGLVLFLVLRRKEHRLEYSHLIVGILGGFLFHFIGEAKSQYVMPYYLLMVPFAVEGYRRMTDRLRYRWEMRREKGFLKPVLRTGTVRIGLILGCLIVIFSFMKGPVMTSTIRLGGQERDYVWYCLHETEWKNADYFKR